MGIDLVGKFEVGSLDPLWQGDLWFIFILCVRTDFQRYNPYIKNVSFFGYIPLKMRYRPISISSHPLHRT